MTIDKVGGFVSFSPYSPTLHSSQKLSQYYDSRVYYTSLHSFNEHM